MYRVLVFSALMLSGLSGCGNPAPNTETSQTDLKSVLNKLAENDIDHETRIVALEKKTGVQDDGSMMLRVMGPASGTTVSGRMFIEVTPPPPGATAATGILASADTLPSLTMAKEFGEFRGKTEANLLTLNNGLTELNSRQTKLAEANGQILERLDEIGQTVKSMDERGKKFERSTKRRLKELEQSKSPASSGSHPR